VCRTGGVLLRHTRHDEVVSNNSPARVDHHLGHCRSFSDMHFLSRIPCLSEGARHWTVRWLLRMPRGVATIPTVHHQASCFFIRVVYFARSFSGFHDEPTRGCRSRISGHRPSIGSASRRLSDLVRIHDTIRRIPSPICGSFQPVTPKRRNRDFRNRDFRNRRHRKRTCRGFLRRRQKQAVGHTASQRKPKSSAAFSSATQRLTSRSTPPEIKVETFANTCGVARPPGDAKYLGNHTG